MGRQLQSAPSNGVRAGRQGGARGPFSCMPKNEAMPGAQGAATSRSLHTAPAETTGARLAAIELGKKDRPLQAPEDTVREPSGTLSYYQQAEFL